MVKLFRGFFPLEIKEMEYIPLTPENIEKIKEQIPVPKYLWDTPQNVRHSLRVIGDEFGLSWTQKDMLCDICYAESGYNPKAKLVNSVGSVDRGLFQWNSYWHPKITDEIAYDPEKNTRLACQAILDGKAMTYWKASAKNWNKNNKYFV